MTWMWGCPILGCRPFLKWCPFSDNAKKAGCQEWSILITCNDTRTCMWWTVAYLARGSVVIVVFCLESQLAIPFKPSRNPMSICYAYRTDVTSMSQAKHFSDLPRHAPSPMIWSTSAILKEASKSLRRHPRRPQWVYQWLSLSRLWKCGKSNVDRHRAVP